MEELAPVNVDGRPGSPLYRIPRNGDTVTQTLLGGGGGIPRRARNAPAAPAVPPPRPAEPAAVSALGAAVAAGDADPAALQRAEAILAGGGLTQEDLLGAACVAAGAGSVAGVAWCRDRLTLGFVTACRPHFLTRPLWAALDAGRPGVVLWILERAPAALLTREAMIHTTGDLRARLLGLLVVAGDQDVFRGLLRAWRGLDAPALSPAP